MKCENRNMKMRPGLSFTFVVRNEYGGAFTPSAS